MPVDGNEIIRAINRIDIQAAIDELEWAEADLTTIRRLSRHDFNTDAEVWSSLDATSHVAGLALTKTEGAREALKAIHRIMNVPKLQVV